MSNVKNEKQLATFTPSDYMILRPSTDMTKLKRVFAVNNGGKPISPFDLARIPFPTAGSTTWDITTLEGAEEAKAIDCIIIYFTEPRAYWAEAFGTGGAPPDCSSEDGISGIGAGITTENPRGLCGKCPMAAFGSKTTGSGRGQACKQMRRIFLLSQAGILPTMINLPPSSIKPMRAFFRALTSERMLPYYAVITRLELVKDKNADGIAFSMINPSVVGELPEAELARIEEYAAELAPYLSKIEIDGKDFSDSE